MLNLQIDCNRLLLDHLKIRICSQITLSDNEKAYFFVKKLKNSHNINKNSCLIPFRYLINTIKLNITNLFIHKVSSNLLDFLQSKKYSIRFTSSGWSDDYSCLRTYVMYMYHSYCIIWAV